MSSKQILIMAVAALAIQSAPLHPTKAWAARGIALPASTHGRPPASAGGASMVVAQGKRKKPPARTGCKENSKWCGKTGKGGGTRVVVVVDSVSLFKEPTATSSMVTTLSRGDVLVRAGVDKSNKWYLVETMDQSFQGWIAISAVGEKDNLVAARAPEPVKVPGRKDGDKTGTVRKDEDEGDDEDADDEESQPKAAAARGAGETAMGHKPGAAGHGSRKLQANATAGVGFTAIGRDLAGSGGAAGYAASAQALSARVSGQARMPVTSKVVAGVDLGYGFSKSVAGMGYTPVGGVAVDPVGFVDHQLSAAVLAGYQAPRYGAYLRLGYALDNLAMDNIDADNSLPSEFAHGPIVGVEFLAPHITGALSGRLRADYQLVLARDQSENREDGMDLSSASGIRAELSALYAITPKLFIDGTYAFGLALTSWTGVSTRDDDVVDASRTDQSHMVTVAVGTHF